MGYATYEDAVAAMPKPEGYRVQGVFTRRPLCVEVSTLLYAPGYKPTDGYGFISWAGYIADLVVKGVCTGEFPHIPILEGQIEYGESFNR